MAELQKLNTSDENGHAESPDETLSPTSVIYFKEALSSSVVFGSPQSPTPLRRDDFQIKKSESRLKNPKDPIAIERLNLMNMAKLSIKGLIESALNLDVLWILTMHLSSKDVPWSEQVFLGALELVEKLNPEAGEITASVKDLPGLKTPLGRGRAWLRLALMQKKLSDYMKTIINRKDLLSEFYEPNALMMEEEGAVIAGLLVGLNVIDANLCMKGEDLDSQVGVIDFSMYLKDGGNTSKSAEGDGQITAILDQKNYLEELNRHLSASVYNLQAKSDALEKSNARLTEELAVLESRKTVRSESANGQALGETRKQLKEETQLRLDVEKELEVQIGIKQEMELSMKMLEKDICEKQDTLVELRLQLDDMRAILLQLSHKAQSAEASSKQKSEAVSRLEDKINQMSGTIKQLEARYKQAEKEKELALEANRLFKLEFGDKIESLQKEVEHLKKQRSKLQHQLRRQQEQRSEHQANIVPRQLSTPQRERSNTIATGSDQSLSGHEDQASLGSNLSLSLHEDEQDESLLEITQASVCIRCEHQDSLLKAKKQCKNCTGVFCESCVSNELPLPSSILPECVCNDCYSLLLQQYASSPT
ncbi:hypothetical protein WMY93_004026 [Mugilogobius chulae]|uniref:RUN domain-containing protein n=1 Tax=Mugilogobius chulae TaxID=88201 RepID=A0AAW0PMH1_9GOBI